ncbi:MAG: DUF4115 domain-containing protein [Chloroflexi bacterium]|nr:DUF4115 domain-containing protein [Chloroflexota bacterium]
MKSLGVWLSEARLAKGVSLQEAAATTCIRLKYLEMLEAGNTAAFPGGTMQARGFLSIYARYLGLSTDEAMARYDSEVRGRASAVMPGSPPERATPSAPPVPVAKPVPSVKPVFRPGLRRPVGLVGRVGMWAAVVVALVGLGVAGYFFSRGAPTRATAQTFAPLAAEEPDPTSSPTTPAVAIVEVTPIGPPVVDTLEVATATVETSVDARDDVSLILEATEHVWVRVVQDDQRVFENLMTPGQVERWSGVSSISVESGNGAGLLVTVNDRLLGPLGERGQVSRRAWTTSGELSAP